MPGPEHVTISDGDVVAVHLAPGPEWLDIVAETWEAGAALFPLDHRLPETMASDLLERARPTVIRDPGGSRRVDGDRAAPGDAVILHTSGTANGPKLVRLGRSAVEAAVGVSSAALGATRDDAWLCCLPVAHVGGLLVLLRGILLGAPVTVHKGFDAGAVGEADGVSYTSLVPTMLRRLLDAGVDVSHFRTILVGGSRLPADLRERAERSGAHVVETYGLTESCGGVVYDGSPLAGTEVRTGPNGRIALRGPTLMSGYRFGDAPPLSDDGWLRTEDAGEIDPGGRLRVLGRLDEMIVSGGEKVWPPQVEAALVGNPKVLEVAIAGRPDPEWGERVVAWVVPRDPSDPPRLEELRESAASGVSRHAAPRELRIVARLPRTFSGKVRRAALPGD